VFQPGFDDRRYNGINPYALGFAMMQDIRRICSEPTPEDIDWFPDIAGNGDWRATIKDIWANYRDESFVRQFLSPKLMRDFKLFMLDDKEQAHTMKVSAIHDEDGYRKVRSALADSYDLSLREPDVQIVDVDLKGDRELVLRHTIRDGVPLAEKERKQVLDQLYYLWGYPVRLEGVAGDSGEIAYACLAGRSAEEG
jgi:spore cortex formation protein SpoVR/YcgB (stage V sporulation)